MKLRASLDELEDRLWEDCRSADVSEVSEGELCAQRNNSEE